MPTIQRSFRLLLVGAVTGISLVSWACSLPQLDPCYGGEENQGTMTATVDGTAFESCLTVGTLDNGVLAVVGQSYPDGIIPHQLQVSTNDATTGSFDLGGTASGLGRYTQGTDVTYVTATDQVYGTLVIDSMSDSGASGTFNFSARSGNDVDDFVEVTDGAFSIDF